MAQDRVLRVVIVGDSRGGQQAFRDLDSAGGASESRLTAVGQKMDAAGDRMVGVGKKMTTHVTLPLVGIGIVAVKTAADFEQTMNSLAVVAEVPAPEMEKLSALAMKMGADTVFSAGEAAKAMLELAKAGVSTADITGGALQASLNLAAVEGMDLADSATLVANSLNVFKLRGDEANIVVDALAGASKASSASVEDMAFAFQMGGSAASAAGLSVQEFSAMLAAMASAGIKGSDAGTSVKSMLLNLQPTTKKATNMMRDLGLNFVDAAGNFIPMREIAGQLHDKLGGLGEATRLTALETIFGADAMRAANVLTNEGTAGYDKLTEAASKHGTAQELADARMKGTAGALERMKGSLDTAAIKMGAAMAPAVEKVAGWIEKLANWFTALSPATQEWIVKGLFLVAVIGPILVVVGSLVGAIGSLIPILITVGGFIAALGAPVLIAIAAFILLYTKCEVFRDQMNAVFTQIWQIVAGAFNIIMGIVKIVTGIIQGDWSLVWEGVKQVLSGALSVIVGLIRASFELIWRIPLEVLSRIPGLFADAFGGALGAVQSAGGAILNFVSSIPGRILGALGDLGGLLFGAGKAIIEGLWRGMESLGGWIADKVIGLVKSIIPGPVRKVLNIDSPSKVMAAIGVNIMEGLGGGITSERVRIAQMMGDVAHDIASTPLFAADITGATGRLQPFPVPTAQAVRGSSGGARLVPVIETMNVYNTEEADYDVMMRRVEFAVDAAGL